MNKQFPVFENSADATCFNCGGMIMNKRESGNAHGHGAYVGECTSCRMETWYDLQAPAKPKLGYAAFYNGKTYGVYADSLLDAKNKALAHFNPPKSKRHMVTVMLAQKDDKPVVHKPYF